MNIQLINKNNITNKTINWSFAALTVSALILVILSFQLAILTTEIKQQKSQQSLFNQQEKAAVLHKQQIEKYNKFANEIKEFYELSASSGLQDSYWNKHEISIVDREVKYSELKRFVEQSQSDTTQYFIPKKLTIKAKTSATNNNSQFQKYYNDNNETDTVMMTLLGTYLIFKENYVK